MTTLFGKIREHELELGRLKKEEEEEENSKKKDITLKMDSRKLDANSNNKKLDCW